MITRVHEFVVQEKWLRKKIHGNKPRARTSEGWGVSRRTVRNAVKDIETYDSPKIKKCNRCQIQEEKNIFTFFTWQHKNESPNCFARKEVPTLQKLFTASRKEHR